MCYIRPCSVFLNVLFYFSFGCLYVYTYEFSSKVDCGSALGPGASGLPYYYSPHVCVPDIIGGLAVWRHNKPKTKNLFLWVCVVCVCFLLYLSVYLCFARCVFRVPSLFRIHNHFLNFKHIDWCCFYYFVRNSLVVLLEALCATSIYLPLNTWPCPYDFISVSCI